MVSEREWREAAENQAVLFQRVLLPAAEMLKLSSGKLKVLEAAQRLDELAERQHLESCRKIEKDAAELLPKVGGMDASAS